MFSIVFLEARQLKISLTDLLADLATEASTYVSKQIIRP